MSQGRRVWRYFCSLLLAACWVSPVLGLTGEDVRDYYSAEPDRWALLDDLDPLPGWEYGKMVDGLLHELKLNHQQSKVKNVRVRLLAWSTQEDDRPLLVDSALLWATFDTSEGKRWVLSHMFRHPRTYPEWMDASPTCVEWSDTILFTSAPTNHELEALIDPAPYHRSFFVPMGSDFMIHSSDVRKRTWQAVMGEQAKHYFTKER